MINRLAEYEPARAPSDWRQATTPGGPTMQQRAEELWGQATRWVVQHPEAALAGAIITGVVLGWLIKRR